MQHLIVTATVFFHMVGRLGALEAFNPTVSTRCLNGFMLVTIRTDLPYHGVAYARGRRQQCYVTGLGGLETSINIPLTAADECGVHYDEARERYHVILDVRQHNMIILQQDRTFNVSCPGSYVSADPHDKSTLLSLAMGLFNNKDEKVHTVVFGQPYMLRIHAIENKENNQFAVKSCFAFASFNYSLELTDQTGCSTDLEFLSNFEIHEVEHAASARLFSMFKFPHYMFLHIQCAVVVCQSQQCPRYDCGRKRHAEDRAAVSGVLSDVGDQRFVSTTVTVVDVGNITGFDAEPIYRLPACKYYYSLLTSLCVIFAVLLAVAIGINIVFCTINGICPSVAVKLCGLLDAGHLTRNRDDEDNQSQQINNHHVTANYPPLYSSGLWYPGCRFSAKSQKSCKSSGLYTISSEDLLSTARETQRSLCSQVFEKDVLKFTDDVRELQ